MGRALDNFLGIQLKIHPTTQLINPLKIYLKAKKKINHKKFHQLIITPLTTYSKKKNCPH